MEILGGLVAGCFIGGILGFVGAGGAMLTVPILIYLFDFTPQSATTAALAVVLLAAGSGLIPKLKNRDVLIKEALVIWSLGLVTNIASSLVAYKLSDNFITTGFSMVMLVAAATMLIKPVSGAEKKVPIIWLILISLIIGCITGFFGIGGGFLAIPILVLFFKNTPAKAAGTSLAIISLNSSTAFLGHFQGWGSVNWKVPISMALAAVIVSRLASIKSKDIKPEILRYGFVILLFVISIFTLTETWILAA
jgi:uncharacterized membrane protein YfcA